MYSGLETIFIQQEIVFISKILQQSSKITIYFNPYKQYILFLFLMIQHRNKMCLPVPPVKQVMSNKFCTRHLYLFFLFAAHKLM